MQDTSFRRDSIRTVYLSYPITSTTDFPVYEWKDRVGNLLISRGIKCLDPLDNGHKPGSRTNRDIRAIVEDDMAMMSDADALIGLYVVPSVGQSMEVFHMYASGKPCAMFTTATSAKRMSAWMLYHAKIFSVGAEDVIVGLTLLTNTIPFSYGFNRKLTHTNAYREPGVSTCRSVDVVDR